LPDADAPGMLELPGPQPQLPKELERQVVCKSFCFVVEADDEVVAFKLAPRFGVWL
jgi:hypothetical protein